MDILKIIAYLLIAILPLAVLIRDWKFSDKRTKKNHNITLGIIILWLIVSVVSACFVLYDSAKIDNYQKILEEKNEKIITLTEKISNWISGGDSYCFIYPMIDEISDRQTLGLWHQGENPIFDVSISIENRSIDLPLKERYEEIRESHAKDVAERRIKKRDLQMEMDQLLNSRKERFNPGNLSPGTMVNLSRHKLPEEEQQEFFIQIHTRNGYFTQTIKQKKVNGRWKSTWQLLKHENNGELKKLETFIPPDFEFNNNS